jgi:hypothetical protein
MMRVEDRQLGLDDLLAAPGLLTAFAELLPRAGIASARSRRGKTRQTVENANRQRARQTEEFSATAKIIHGVHFPL